MKTHISLQTIGLGLSLILAHHAGAQLPPASPTPAPAKEVATPKNPNNSGPVKLVSASWLGGQVEDEIVGVAITSGKNILLAGNGIGVTVPGPIPKILGQADTSGAPAPAPAKEKPNATDSPDATGFIAMLTADGQRATAFSQFPAGGATLKKLMLDAAGNIFVLGNARGQLELAGAKGTGTFVAMLAPDLSAAKSCIFQSGAIDFDVDANGDVVFLTKGHMVRYKAAGGEPLWDVTWKSHGDNRPGGMAIDKKTGIAAVVGYGMTHTGHEPYKDPYAYAFDRSGKPVWALWNPDPKHQADAKYGGTGLMADTTGKFAGSGADGSLFLALYADGGNTVTTRNPRNENELLDKKVFAGVHQDGPGFGFKGASSTAVIFRVNAQTGNLEKGTFMSAWLTPQRANGLGMDEVASGTSGNIFIAGGSASGCPTKDPWYQAPEGGYKGGGFLAVLDREFKMRQCGYFPGTDIQCVAERDGLVVIGGKAVEKAKAGDVKKGETQITYGVPTFKPLQPKFSGGRKDGYFAIFDVTR